MSYDEKLAERVRDVLDDEDGIAERKMFGGLAFLDRGHMCCGIVKTDLMVRVGPDAYDDALAKPHCRAMDFTGKPMKGLVYVAAAGLRDKRSLRRWVGRGLAFTRTQPPKLAKR